MSDLPREPPGPRGPRLTARETAGNPTTRETAGNPTTRETAGNPTTRETGNPTTREPTPTESLTLLPSALRDRYRSLGELPSQWGGEASLLVAERLDDGETVVVKVYQRGLVLDRAVLDTLHTAQLDHVVALHEAGESDGRWYEVQEYIRGGTLQELVERFPDRRLPRKELRAVVKELTAAVHHLHQLQVMHKDLKPANILVRALNPFDLVLADFGLASLTDLSMRAVSKSRTAAYSAPELRAGFAGWASDWWSVGIIVAEMAGGAHPFEGLQEQAIDFAVSMRPVPLTASRTQRWRTSVAACSVATRSFVGAPEKSQRGSRARPPRLLRRSRGRARVRAQKRTPGSSSTDRSSSIRGPSRGPSPGHGRTPPALSVVRTSATCS